ncbi:hypothetical protein SULI_13640 [Saccharolobus solfataricus]|uniref:Uncharacterized protein n=1 Tax=Saccharolobus solfataricus TaxID=2287 RepID=A0A0E3MB93_SACSO|nr:hypothetical protein SULB_2678 [Saccharolobus solfataricus]AKA77455.1 hypothetical protein SULC_2675 [Saccharolobus solfataricus]AKA80145.1 hypothetical protein SULA_2677 [Saccharolobus solfataricus]AZF69226.1 hypothetical protein SULG_13640 [Saccharolobus solfataricus]AZF71846.1 hypothetical protein SULH_13640 [Saccharolobus solfataricus]
MPLSISLYTLLSRARAFIKISKGELPAWSGCKRSEYNLVLGEISLILLMSVWESHFSDINDNICKIEPHQFYSNIAAYIL